MDQGIMLVFAVQLVLIFWLGGVSLLLYRWYSTYRQLTQGIDKKEFSQILNKLLQNDSQSTKEIEQINKTLIEISEQVKPHIQKIGFVRYNPFGNTGGDQSFCLSLLDGRGNGILLTSLHARQQTRIYTKEIINNKPKDDTQLSKEEKDCIKSAQKWS